MIRAPLLVGLSVLTTPVVGVHQSEGTCLIEFFDLAIGSLRRLVEHYGAVSVRFPRVRSSGKKRTSPVKSTTPGMSPAVNVAV